MAPQAHLDWRYRAEYIQTPFHPEARRRRHRAGWADEAFADRTLWSTHPIRRPDRARRTGWWGTRDRSVIVVMFLPRCVCAGETAMRTWPQKAVYVDRGRNGWRGALEIDSGPQPKVLG